MASAIISTETQHALISDFGDAWGETIYSWLLNFDSNRTRENYLRAWRQLMELVKKHPMHMTQADVITFKSHLAEQSLSQSTINARLSAVSSFYRFAVDRGMLDENPVDGVKRRAVSPYGKATALNPDKNEHIRFLQAIDQTTAQGKRDFAMMLIFLTTGVRKAAIVNARLGNIRQTGSNWYLHYEAKGGKEAKAELSTLAINAIDAYLATRENLTDERPLFVATERGRMAAAHSPHVDTYEEKPLTGQTVYNLVKKYARLAGFDNITPHSLRHTVAMRLKDKPIGKIAALLGHSNLRVTTIYLQHLDQLDTSAETAELANDFDGMLLEGLL